MKPEPLIPSVKDISKKVDVLSPVDLSKLIPLPPPYDAIDPATMWKELTPEKKALIDASADGVSALGLKRPTDPAEEKRLLDGFVAGLHKLLSRDDNWTFLQALQLTLDHCTHCQTCAEACPIFTGSGENEIYRPTLPGRRPAPTDCPLRPGRERDQVGARRLDRAQLGDVRPPRRAGAPLHAVPALLPGVSDRRRQRPDHP